MTDLNESWEKIDAKTARRKAIWFCELLLLVAAAAFTTII